MRLRAKVDGNQPEIVRALREAGASVQTIARMGHGVPDLLVGWRGKNFLFEVKDPSKRLSDRKLTDDEKAWHYTWNGQVAVIESIEAAFEVMESC